MMEPEPYQKDKMVAGLRRWTGEGHFMVLMHEKRGRCVVTTKDIPKDSFVLEYECDVVSYAEGLIREEIYREEQIGCYMIFVEKSLVLDGTLHFRTLGRLVNHVGDRPNLKVFGPVEVDPGKPKRLALYSTRAIMKGEELFWTYDKKLDPEKFDWAHFTCQEKPHPMFNDESASLMKRTSQPALTSMMETARASVRAHIFTRLRMIHPDRNSSIPTAVPMMHESRGGRITRGVRRLAEAASSPRPPVPTTLILDPEDSRLLESEMEKSVADLQQYKTTVEDLQMQIRDLEREKQREVQWSEECRVQLIEKDTTLHEEQRKLLGKEAEVCDLEEQLGYAKEHLGYMEIERTHLHLQIEADKYVNTTIKQLEQENTILKKKLSDVDKCMKMQVQEHQEKLDLLYKQQQDDKIQLQQVTQAKADFEDSLKHNQEKLEATKSTVSELEGELKSKLELLLSTETAKTTQCADLENHIKTMQDSLNEKINEVTKIKGQLDQVRRELTKEKVQARSLDRTVNDQMTRMPQCKDQHTKACADATSVRTRTIQRADKERPVPQGSPKKKRKVASDIQAQDNCDGREGQHTSGLGTTPVALPTPARTLTVHPTLTPALATSPVQILGLDSSAHEEALMDHEEVLTPESNHKAQKSANHTLLGEGTSTTNNRSMKRRRTTNNAAASPLQAETWDTQEVLTPQNFTKHFRAALETPNQQPGQFQQGKTGRFMKKAISELSWRGLLTRLFEECEGQFTLACQCDVAKLLPSAQAVTKHIVRHHMLKDEHGNDLFIDKPYLTITALYHA